MSQPTGSRECAPGAASLRPRAGQWVLAFACALGMLTDLKGPTAADIAYHCGDIEGVARAAAEVFYALPLRDRSFMLMGLTVLIALLFCVLGIGCGKRTARRCAAGGIAAWVVAVLMAAALLFGWSFDEVGSARLVAGDAPALIRTLTCGAAWSVVLHAGACWLFGVFDRLRAGSGEGASAAASGAPHRSGIAAIACGLYRRWKRWAGDERPFRGPALTLAVLWLPVLIGYAPALFMWDTDTQILQWFNLPNHLSDSVALLDPGVLLTQHHPPLHTALVGLCVQVGLALGNENLGIFLYALMQWTVDILAIAWAFRALAAFGANRRARIAAFAFIALVPAFSNYAVLVTKDVLFAAALLVYIVELVYLVRGVPTAEAPGASVAIPAALAAVDEPGVSGGRNASGDAGGRLRRGARARSRTVDPTRAPAPVVHVVLLIVAALGVTLLRSGMVVAVAAGTVVALVLAPGRRRFAVAALGTCVGVSLLLSHVVYPALAITPTSKRETLSIPFQQVACFMRDNPDQVTGADRAVIDQVLDADAIADLYDPIISDPVKATYRIDATDEDLAAFFSLWLRWFGEDPACYLTATAANYYGYFYPGRSMNWSYPSSFSRRAMTNTATTLTYSDIGSYFDFEPAGNPLSVALDAVCSTYRSAFQYLPVLTLTMQAALYDWALVAATAYAAHRRLPWLAAALIPCWMVLLVSLVGPCNATTYFRYAYPVALAMPWLLTLMTAGQPAPGAPCPARLSAGLPAR